MATVLIVDDSSYTRRTHRRILESGGHAVVEAASGMAAIESYFLHHPDLVLLDLTMEDMSGLEALAKLRALDAAARVVVVSADVQRTTTQAVTESGALAFLPKPVESDALLRTVRELVGEPSS